VRWVEALGVLAAMAATDFCWAGWAVGIERRSARVASLYSVAIVLLGGASVLAYVRDAWMLAPACLGTVLGTTLHVRLASRPRR